MQSYLLSKYRWAADEVKRLVIQQKLGPQQPVAGTQDLSNVLKPKCAGPDSFKVATFNLWNINAPWLVRRDRIAEMMKSLSPDIVGFQEVRLYENENQLQGLLKQLPSEYRYVYSKMRSETNGQEEGLAVMSRHEILSTSTLVLETEGAKDNRACLHALVNVTSFGLVNFFVTHFVKYN